jgi:hypothetical protein
MFSSLKKSITSQLLILISIPLGTQAIYAEKTINYSPKPKNPDLISDNGTLRISYNIDQGKIYYSDTSNKNRTETGAIKITGIIRNSRNEAKIIKGVFQDSSTPMCSGNFYLEKIDLNRYISSWTITGGDNYDDCPSGLNFKINLRTN